MGLFGGDLAVFGKTHFQLDNRRHSRTAGDELVFAAVEQSNRPADLFGKKRRNQRVVLVGDLTAEGAPYIWLYDADFRLALVERRRQMMPRVPDALGIAPDRQPAALVVRRHGSNRFDVGVELITRGEGFFEDEVGFVESGLNRAALYVDRYRDIALLVVVNESRALGEGLLQVEQRRQLLILNLDEFERRLGYLLAGGRHSGDLLPEVANTVDRHGDLILDDHAPPAVRYVGAGYDTLHAP